MNFLKKLQNLPESKRKMILWLTIAVIALAMFIFWFKVFQEQVKALQFEDIKEELNFPSLKDELKDLPKIEMPKFETPNLSDEQVKELEEKIQ